MSRNRGAVFAAVLLLAAAPAFAQSAATYAPPTPVAPQTAIAPGAGPAADLAAPRAAAHAACVGDIARFCPNVQPGGGHMMACFKQNQASVSAGCKQALQNLRAAMKARRAAQAGA